VLAAGDPLAGFEEVASRWERRRRGWEGRKEWEGEKGCIGI